MTKIEQVEVLTRATFELLGNPPSITLDEDQISIDDKVFIVHGYQDLDFFTGLTVRIDTWDVTVATYDPWDPYNAQVAGSPFHSVHAAVEAAVLAFMRERISAYLEIVSERLAPQEVPV